MAAADANPFRLDAKVALVTGASRGIGQAAAVALAEAGANVAILGNSCLPEATCDAIKGLGRESIALRGDLSTEEFREETIARVVETWGRIDILVNNANHCPHSGRRFCAGGLGPGHRREPDVGVSDVPTRGAAHARSRKRKDHQHRFALELHRWLHNSRICGEQRRRGANYQGARK